MENPGRQVAQAADTIRRAATGNLAIGEYEAFVGLGHVLRADCTDIRFADEGKVAPAGTVEFTIRVRCDFEDDAIL